MHKWTDRELMYVRKHIYNRSWADMTEMFNRRFGFDVTEGQLKRAANGHGIRNGISMSFRNFHRVGMERTVNGYVEVKTGYPSKWKRKHVLVWEKANMRKVPRKHIVIFADGDKRNFAFDNLLLISKSENRLMNLMGLRSNDKDLTETGKIVADIIIQAAKCKKRLKGTT